MSPPDLVGWRVPGGTSRVEPYENLLLHDAVRSPRSARPHPVWAFLAPQRGMGLSLAALFEQWGTPLHAGPVLGSFGARLHAPLAVGVDHRVDGGVTAVTRRTSRVLGAFDEVTLVLELGRNPPIVTATYGFLLPRRDVAAVVTTVRDRPPTPPRAEEVVGPGLTVREEEMKLLARLLRDPNPIHLDPDAAAALGFGRACVNQGPANLAYALTHLVRSRPGERLGALDARFHATVLAGDVVHPVVARDGTTGSSWTFALRGSDGRLAVSGRAELVPETATL